MIVRQANSLPLDLKSSTTTTLATTTATTTAAFNKLTGPTNNSSSSDHMMVHSNHITPFLMNNVSNLNNMTVVLQQAAFNAVTAKNNHSVNVNDNVNDNDNNVLMPLKLNKNKRNTATTAAATILKINSKTATATAAAKTTDLNASSKDATTTIASCNMPQMKKVNFIIPENNKIENESVDDCNADAQEKLQKNSPQKTSYNNLVATNNTPQHYQHQHSHAHTHQHHRSHHLTPSQFVKYNQPNLLNKNIVFNGTFPIDMPLHTHFNNYDPEAANINANDKDYEAYESSSNYDDDEDVYADNDYDDDDDDDDVDEDDDLDFDDDDDESNDKHCLLHSTKTFGKETKPKPPSAAAAAAALPSHKHHHYHNQHHQVWSMQELINDPSIPLNYKKMCNEVEQSLQQFEQYIDSKTYNDEKSFKMKASTKQPPVLRTFNIDDPIDLKKNI